MDPVGDDADIERAIRALDDTGAVGAGLDAVDSDGLDRRLRAIARVAGAFDALGISGTGPTAREPPCEHWGPFVLRECIGSGNFGVVFRAFDPAVAREIAVKLYNDVSLPEEPRLMARVRHPNVVTVFGAAVHDTRPGIWMELVHGRTLAERVQSEGPISPAEAARIGVALCGAVQAVHEAHLLHQDVKPQNVMEDETGRVVLMDFGAGIPPSDDPEGPDRVVGTPLYMAPEVVLGRAPSVQSDVYSLGVLLYYLLTGTYPVYAGGLTGLRELHRRQHHRAGTRRFVAALLELRPEVPRPLAEAVARALEPAARRFATARELQAALEAAGDARPRAPRVPVWAVVAASAALGAALAYGVVRSHARKSTLEPGLPSAETSEAVPLTSAPGSEFHPALSAMGDRVAFVWDGDERGNYDIYVKQVDGSTMLRLTHDPAFDCCPAFSPDGKSISFIRVSGNRGVILQVPALGGPERRLVEIETWTASALGWSPDGESLVYSDMTTSGRQAIFRISTRTLARRQLTEPGAESLGDGFAQISPDGRSVAFARIDGESGQDADLAVVPIEGGRPRLLHREAHGIRGLDWTPDGDVVFWGLRENPAHLFRIHASGGAAVALGHVLGAHAQGGSQTLDDVGRALRLSISRTGRIAFTQSQYDTDIWQVDPLAPLAQRHGRPLIASTRIDEAPQYSPDGRRIAFSSERSSPRPQIWTCASDGTDCFQLTSLASTGGSPRWSPDGQRIAFDAFVDDRSAVFVVDVATRVVTQLTHEGEYGVPSWTHDGRSLYVSSKVDRRWELFRMPAEGGPAVQVTHAGAVGGSESKDGRTLYYTGEEGGLWSMPLPSGPETKLLDAPRCWGYWAEAPQGLYFLDGSEIRLRRSSGHIDDVMPLGGEPACAESGLAASPDGKSLLYVVAKKESDLMMVDLLRPANP
jgi:Tol biopolymer transport system component